ncbi:MAG: hypothetical protein ACYTF0_07220 [Planctomycetota bacterium]
MAVVSYDLGSFAADPRRFVTCVLGLARFRILAAADAIDADEQVVAELTADGGRYQVCVAADAGPASMRDEAEARPAQAEAEAAYASFRATTAEAERRAEAADNAIHDAHDRIRAAEAALVEAKHQQRAAARERSDARTAYWLAMDNIAAFGSRDP